MSEVPWKQTPLDQWSICGMNHYFVDGEQHLFVAMVKDGICITEEGNDDKYLWNRLWHKASNANSDFTHAIKTAISSTDNQKLKDDLLNALAQLNAGNTCYGK